MLVWDPSEHGGVESVVIPANEIWLPELGMLNRWATNGRKTLYYIIFLTLIIHTSMRRVTFDMFCFLENVVGNWKFT